MEVATLMQVPREGNGGREGSLTSRGQWLSLDHEQNLDWLGIHGQRVPLLSVVVCLDCKRALEAWMGMRMGMGMG